MIRLFFFSRFSAIVSFFMIIQIITIDSINVAISTTNAALMFRQLMISPPIPVPATSASMETSTFRETPYESSSSSRSCVIKDTPAGIRKASAAEIRNEKRISTIRLSVFVFIQIKRTATSNARIMSQRIIIFFLIFFSTYAPDNGKNKTEGILFTANTIAAHVPSPVNAYTSQENASVSTESPSRFIIFAKSRRR